MNIKTLKILITSSSRKTHIINCINEILKKYNIHTKIFVADFNKHVSTKYFGDYLYSKALPWHYLPIMIIITTPITFFITFLIGLYNSLKSAIVEDFKPPEAAWQPNPSL